MENRNLLTIGEVSRSLGVSIKTLRRWDESGKLVSIRKKTGGNRYYRRGDIDFLTSDILKTALDWAVSGKNFPEKYYCRFSDVFQSRLISMETQFIETKGMKDIYPLIVSIAGEIGNNSFDHNLGQWPDAPGIFFGYDLDKRQIVLADRGLGVLATLKRVKTGLKSHKDALRVAFTEIVSGRAPESRGNGLKYVRQVVSRNPINLLFRSGNAKLQLHGGSEDLEISETKDKLPGCIAFISY